MDLLTTECVWGRGVEGFRFRIQLQQYYCLDDKPNKKTEACRTCVTVLRFHDSFCHFKFIMVLVKLCRYFRQYVHFLYT